MNASEKVKFISNWIKDYAENMPSKAQSLVIGISGGIDSSVSSTLSAMTGLKTIVLTMPIKQKSHQHDLSLNHVDEIFVLLALLKQLSLIQSLHLRCLIPMSLFHQKFQ